MQNKNPFQIKILRKKKSKIFQTHPITINLLLVSILFAESFEIQNFKDNFRLKNWDEFYPKKLKILWKRNQFPQIVV